jgi:hypothetical protein
MKNTVRLLIPLLLLAFTTIQCSETCTTTTTTHYYEPIYMSFETLRASVEPRDPHELSSPGKIYFKDNYLYINEVGKGIHVIDNSDPSHPEPKSFINIPGNFDLAIRNDILYADSYVDLVAIDISQVGAEREVTRYPNMFQSYSNMHFYADPVRGVIADLKEVTNVTVEDTDCNSYGWMPGGWRYSMEGDMMAFTSSSSSKASSYAAPAGNSTGTAGSLARFAVIEDYLYALDNANMKVLNVSDPQVIDKKNDIMIAWDIETIFPMNDKLFIGSQSGMHIFDAATPASPTKLSTYSHVRSCDPVVVEGDFAYVTLRSGNTCAGFTNQLEIINVSNVSSPALVKIYPMTNPHGLGVENGTVFVCDGADGLKVLDATDKMQIKSLAHYKDVKATDVILLGNVAMVIGEKGLLQYDYSDLSNIRLLSTLEITPKQ